MCWHCACATAQMIREPLHVPPVVIILHIMHRPRLFDYHASYGPAHPDDVNFATNPEVFT